MAREGVKAIRANDEDVRWLLNQLENLYIAERAEEGTDAEKTRLFDGDMVKNASTNLDSQTPEWNFFTVMSELSETNSGVDTESMN